MKRPLLLQKRFWPMWTALSLGAFADNLLRQSLIIGLTFGAISASGFDHGEDAIPIVGSFFAVAMLVFSTIAGQVADKYETAMLFRRIKFAEVLLMLTAGIGFLINSGWLLIAVLLAMGAQSAFFSPVRLGAMPKYLEAGELVRGNGLCNAGLYVSILLGLFAGGLLIGQEGGRLLVAGALFAASLVGWLAVLRAPHAAATAPDLKLHWNPLAQAQLIFGYALKARGVSRPLLGVAFFYYTSTLVTVLVPLYAKNALGADDVVATLIMGVFAVGAGAGAVGASMLARGRSGLGYSAAGIAASGALAVIVFALTPAVARAVAGAVQGAAGEATPGGALFGSAAGAALMAGFCLSSAAMGFFVAPLQAAVQRRAPAAERSRILAGGNMLNAAAAMLGSLSVLTVTRTGLSEEAAFLAVAGLQGAAALYMFRRRRMLPEGLFDEMLHPPHGENSAAAAASPAAPG